MMTSAIDELRKSLERIVSPEWARAVAQGDDETLALLASDIEIGRLVAKEIAQEGWFTPEWPPEYGGRGLSPDEAVDVRREIARWRVGLVESAIGAGWVGPAISTFGTEAQKARLLPPIAKNEELWCQLFSESEAGSDLAGIRSTATRQNGDWLVNGGKIWTSRANLATWGLAVFRSDPDAVKHGGLTCFLVPMDSHGVEIREIRQMTGDAEFFEVRFDNVRLDDDLRLGQEGQGWEIVRAVLTFERKAGSGSGSATPGSIVGRSIEQLLVEHLDDAQPWVLKRMLDLWVESKLVEANNRRNALLASAERPLIGRGTPVNKVLQAEHTKRLQAARMDLGGLEAATPHRSDVIGRSDVWAYLRVQPKTIAGGTSEVLRDQIAERGLGMARSKDPSRGVSWRTFINQTTEGQGDSNVASQ